MRARAMKLGSCILLEELRSNLCSILRLDLLFTVHWLMSSFLRLGYSKVLWFVRPSSVHIFKRLLLWNHWAKCNQISYAASRHWGNEKIAKMVLIWNSRWPPCPNMVKTFKKSSSPEPPGGLGWYFAGSIQGTSVYKRAKIVPVGS